MNSNDTHTSNTTAPGRLLVIDDNKMMRLLLARNLEQQGHKVTMAENGLRGLELLRADSFDMVLLDIQMPEMDGYQTLEVITHDLKLREIPVIMISSLDEVDGVARCIQMGAEDYLFKPPNPILLRARIISSLEKKRLRDQQRELIRKLATSEVADDLLEKGFSLGGQLLQASVLFVDIRSFTTIVESQPSTATIELLNDYYSLMFEAIRGQGGMVNQIWGDGIMALFGAPNPLEKHAECAVRSALEMTDLLELYNQQQKSLGRQEIHIGVGIATGQVISGYTGTMERAIYTCIGDTVNQASRLEEYTKTIDQPILIDENTRQALSDALRVIDCGLVELKGKTQAIKVFSIPPGKS